MPVHRDQVVDLSFVRDSVAYSFPSLVDEVEFGRSEARAVIDAA
jgi:hypothetical protein